MTETTTPTIKWEAALYDELAAHDKVRLTRDDGDVIHAQVAHNGRGIAAAFGFLSLTTLRDSGYSVERVVPEKVLPTENGLYVHRSVAETGIYAGAVVLHRGDDGWSYGHSIEADVAARDANSWNDRGDLVRLVPSTVADKLRADIQHVIQYLDATNRSSTRGPTPGDISYVITTLKKAVGADA